MIGVLWGPMGEDGLWTAGEYYCVKFSDAIIVLYYNRRKSPLLQETC